jgi:hypothetical protein
VRANLPLGDSLAGLHAALGVLLALVARQRGDAGQVVDVSIVESVFNLLEAAVPEYDPRRRRARALRGDVTGIVPSNLYPTRDGRRVVIGANGESNFRRLMTVIGRADLAADPASRATRRGWRARPSSTGRSPPGPRRATPLRWSRTWPRRRSCGGIASVADLVADPHLRARPLRDRRSRGPAAAVPAILPLAATPGGSDWAGPEPGPTIGRSTWTGVGARRGGARRALGARLSDGRRGRTPPAGRGPASGSGPAGDPPRDESDDRDTLQVLAFFYWALAAWAAFVALVPVIYLALAWGIGIDPMGSNLQLAGSHRPELAPSVLALAAAVAATLAAVGFGLAARALRGERRLALCRAMAVLACLFVPFGPILGVYTLLTVGQPEIAARFARR